MPNNDMQDCEDTSSASTRVLQSIPMDVLQRVFQEMFEKEKQVLKQQIRAELLRKGLECSGDSEASFVLVSDGGDAPHENQDPARQTP